MAIRHIEIELLGEPVQMPVTAKAFMDLIDAGIDPVIIMRDLTRRQIKARREGREMNVEECSLGLSGRETVKVICIGCCHKWPEEKIAQYMIESGLYKYDEPVTSYLLAFNTGGEERQFNPERLEGDKEDPLVNATVPAPSDPCIK